MGLERVIGTYTGDEKGPLLICIGSMHGNEPAGRMAVELVLKMLEVEPITNPSFKFCGRFVGLTGNVEASKRELRFVNRDLNRMWRQELIDEIREKPAHLRHSEEKELLELIAEIRKQVREYDPEKVVFLDLHTTAAYGGIFTLVTEDPESQRIGMQLLAPVIKNMMTGIKGTAVQYLKTDKIGVPTTSVVFESGQHNERLSVNRAIAAIINTMRTVGCVEEGDVENRHDELLIEFSSSLPKIAELVYRHEIHDEDDFAMRPGYKNFMRVDKGEHLANDINGKILSPFSGLLLMPLYQLQGEDGFFIIKSLDPDYIPIKSNSNYARQRAGN